MSKTPEATRQVASTLAKTLRPGDVILLRGDLGVGKTEFVKGLAEGLGTAEPVTSPTFTLMNVYEGALTIYHFDLYRLHHAEELSGIGFDEFIGGSGVAVVEWPERFPAEMPAEYFGVEMTVGDDALVRQILVTAVGNRYSCRLEGSEWADSGN